MNIFDYFNKNIRIRTKLIFVITVVLIISIVPISTIILKKSQEIIQKMTFDICTNLAHNISNLATEELLINETFDATTTSITRLKKTNITGLVNSYVINIDGHYVASMEDRNEDKNIGQDMKNYISRLTKLEMQEIRDRETKRTLLRYAYPISISYQNEQLRVGTALFEFDKEIVFEPIVTIRQTILGASGIIFLFGILISVYTSTYFSKPIKILTEGAIQFGEGNMDTKIHLSGKDEIGQLANSFNQMITQIQDFTHNLEKMVAQRTDELNQTLTEVRNLKIAQDGDYYLTSLLLDPLHPNNNLDKRVKTEFLLEQKKKFQFRKWTAEIGGDICITETIKLKGKQYTVFLNGDAMGKSIQGAGGALVLGVVFNAGIMRTAVEKYQNIHPELWLKERYLDINNVFLSFDGSMYISVCLGLVDLETGLLYYFNAEHPWTVLYRDGKASFIDDENNLKKIGTPDQESDFFIKTFQLHYGDKILTGSDGKDDLILTGEDGSENVQEDENEFLKRVEEAKGEIKEIANRVKSTGRIMDDLSLLSIEYLNETVASSEEISNEILSAIHTSRNLINLNKIEEAYKTIYPYSDKIKVYENVTHLFAEIYSRQQDYNKSIDCYNFLCLSFPANNQYLYELSRVYFSAMNYNSAADVAERLYLRNTSFVDNLINLVEIYTNLNVFGRGRFLLDKLKQIDPENKSIQDLEEKFQEKQNKKSSQSHTDMDTDTIEEYYSLAERFFYEGNYKDALVLYLELNNRSEFRNNPTINSKVGICYYYSEDYTLATMFLNKCLNVDNFNFEAHRYLGEILFINKYYKQALEEWTKALKLNPNNNLIKDKIKEVNNLISGVNTNE
ncbi:MAG: SpoIIE family protein phosphatase [Leptospiraceae bacterium]|nr:SpoIIE family protein phosphatase [Leptospiraceae bacterium]MCP5511076.1 SpoIIE family protein phosphatase [Leptospiraceae bacterium]